MRIASILLVWSLAFLIPPCVFAQQWAADMFDVKKHDFGAVGRGAKAEFDFSLTNRFIDDVVIESVSTSCGCTTVTIPKRVLKTYETGSIHAKFNTHLFLGKRGATITVRLSKPQRAVVQLRVDGYIHNDLILTPSSADLGTVEKGTAAERRITVRYAGRQDLKIVDVKTENPHLTATIVPSNSAQRATYELLVQLDDQAPSGYIRDNLLLMTTHYQMRQIPVMVEARVMPEVSVTPSTLFLGVMKPGDKLTKVIVIRGKRPFTITSISADHEGVEFGTTGIDVAKPIHVVPVTIVAGQEAGALVHQVTIQTDVSSETPQLSSYAVVQP